MMNKILIVFVFLVFFSEISAQTVSESDVLGSWKVERVNQAPSNSDFASVLDGFKKATFTFHKTGKFGFSTTSDANEFLELIDMFENTQWKFEKNNQLIRIGGDEDEYSILGIYVERSNGALKFHIDESGLKFVMTEAE